MNTSNLLSVQKRNTLKHKLSRARIKLSATLALLAASIFIHAQPTTPHDELILTQSETLHYANLVNDYFMRTYPDVTSKSYVGGKERTSKIWTRGVYYEGLMSLYRQHQDARWLKYTEDWGNHHQWKASENKQERHADFQCCGQAYLDMYMLDPTQTKRKTHIKKLIDDMLATDIINDWYWIDAIQMAMPIFAQLGVIENDDRYFERMYQMYMYSRNKHGGSKKSGGLPLFNTEDGLWYRDYNYDPPYMDLKEGDKPCYWSRGNGWVYVALARVLHYAPDTVAYRQQYIDDFRLMTDALIACQREDGFWGVSLAAPSNTGDVRSPGPETSGTALFVAGMAYGINAGILDEEKYMAHVIRGWNAMCKEAVHENGFLGYVQGAGAKPEDGQPVLFDRAADFEDFGIGCYLLAAAEVYQLGDVDLGNSSVQPTPAPEQLEIHHISLTNHQLTVSIQLDKESAVAVKLHDISGKLIQSMQVHHADAGKHLFTMPLDHSQGCFICTVETNWGVRTRKVFATK